MRKTIAVLAATLAVVTAVAASPAGASTGRPAAVVIQNPYVDESSATGFSTTGPLCAAGTAETTSRTVLSYGDGYLNLYVTKRFTCGDGSGTFDLALLVHLTFGPFTDSFAWAVTGGTGGFAHLRGVGTGTGVLQPDGTVSDTYTGVVAGG